MKQRIVAQKDVKHDPGGRRAQDDRPDYRSVEIAQELFEREENGSDRCVERRSEGGCSTHGHQPPHLLAAQSKTLADDRRKAGADVNRRTFPTECDAARERRRTAYEFPNDGAQRNPAVVDEYRGACLRDSASPRLRKPPDEKIS
jgi:hypothetical protein